MDDSIRIDPVWPNAVNIDCTANEVIHRQQDVISHLIERVRSLNRMIAQLRVELDELHARHRPKEDQ